MATPTQGKSAQTNPTGRNAHTRQLTDSESYALAKQVPDITSRGCIIDTAYGAIDIPPGRLADTLAALLRRQISRGGLQ